MTSPLSAKPTILIVEDEERDFEIIESYLKLHYQLVRAPNTAEALIKLPQATPVLMILDIELGDDARAGLQLCRVIRNGGERGSLGAFRAMPIIMLTRHDTGEDIDTGYDEGATAYYPKPFRREQLVGQVRVLLRDRHAPDLPAYGIVRLDPERHIVWVNGRETARFSNQEFALVQLLVRAQDAGVEIRELYEKIIGGTYTAKANGEWPNNIRMLVVTVRKKLAALDPSYKWLIKEERARSFLWEDDRAKQRVAEREPIYRLLPVPSRNSNDLYGGIGLSDE